MQAATQQLPLPAATQGLLLRAATQQLPFQETTQELTLRVATQELLLAATQQLPGVTHPHQGVTQELLVAAVTLAWG